MMAEMGKRLGRTNWCEGHWQPYRQLRAGGFAATLLMVHAFAQDERIMREGGWNPETGSLADATKINEVLESHSPVCCFLGDEVMNQILVESQEKGQTKH